MVRSLSRGVGIACARIPTVLGVLADGLSLVIVAAAFLSPSAQTAAEESANNVVLDFTATWCGPCQQMSPIVRKLEQQGYAIRAVDVDREPKLAQQYGIRSIPCFVLVVDGKEVTRITGPTSENQLRQLALQAGQARQRTPPNATPATVPLRQTHSREEERSVDATPNVVLGQPAAGVDFASGATPNKTKSLLNNPKPKFWPFASSDKTVDQHEQAVVRGQARDSESTANSPDGCQPLAATTRLRVNDGKGTNFGTGTIIDSRPGLTTILTCGHIFRPQPGKSKVAVPPTVEVDIFQADGRPETYVGKLVVFDLDGDVGVVTIPTADTLPVIPIAPLDELLAVEDQLLSIGCGGGDVPSVEEVQVTAINRYDGPDNIECTGFPIQGRSGGGLFDPRGQLTGVCIAADKEDQRGLYTGLKPIYEIVQRAGLKQLLPLAQTQARASAEPIQTAEAPGTAQAEPAEHGLRAAEQTVENDTVPVPSAELAALFEDAPQAEIVCIVRPKDGSAKRVVILNQASTRFVSYLLEAVDSTGESAPHAASLRVEDAAEEKSGDWVADSDAGVPKKAPRLGGSRTNRSKTSAKTSQDAAPVARRNRFGSRDGD